METENDKCWQMGMETNQLITGEWRGAMGVERQKPLASPTGVFHRPCLAYNIDQLLHVRSKKYRSIIQQVINSGTGGRPVWTAVGPSQPCDVTRGCDVTRVLGSDVVIVTLHVVRERAQHRYMSFENLSAVNHSGSNDSDFICCMVCYLTCLVFLHIVTSFAVCSGILRHQCAPSDNAIIL